MRLKNGDVLFIWPLALWMMAQAEGSDYFASYTEV